jgi:hypothetical protein
MAGRSNKTSVYKQLATYAFLEMLKIDIRSLGAILNYYKGVRTD